MKARAAAILIEDRQVAMIERRRQGKLFYVFPGGHVKTGESLPAAVAREVKEELGLDVQVGRLVAESTYRERPHYYYLAERLGGVFGSGDGAELTRPADSERGSLWPVWLPVSVFDQVVIYPAFLANLVRQALETGWPNQVVQFIEPETPGK
jgi:8-oxo-dGTP pyrophosphatase MutT (NUDIX family)